MDNNSPALIFLQDFQGPILLLLRLVLKDEIEIDKLPLKELTHQWLAKLKNERGNLDTGADFIATAATLLYLKSCKLLPTAIPEIDYTIEEEDPTFSILYDLIDYYRFKEAAKKLSVLEQQQEVVYPRAAPPLPSAAPPDPFASMSHIELTDLAVLFQSLLLKAPQKKESIEEESWKVSDKIKELESSLFEDNCISLEAIFTPAKEKAEVIVLFLAILELMKRGRISLSLKAGSEQIVLEYKLSKE